MGSRKQDDREKQTISKNDIGELKIPIQQNSKAVQGAVNAMQDHIADANEERLNAFSELDQSEMEEGTAQYYKWEKEGDKLDAMFLGTDMRVLDKLLPDKLTECAILKTKDGAKVLMAQTIIVKELKKQWDRVNELGFPCRIIYTGTKGEGNSKYQSFRILFSK